MNTSVIHTILFIIHFLTDENSTVTASMMGSIVKTERKIISEEAGCGEVWRGLEWGG
jgi:hypothetical protein